MSLKNPTFFAGMYRAAAFAYGIGGSGVAGLQVDMPGGVDANTSTQTLTLAFGNITLDDGTIVSPLNTNAKVTVGTGSGADSVTVSAVSNSTPLVYQSTTFTAATFGNAHGTGDLVASATIGLQEALNYAGAAGGGTVVVDAEWTKLGGTTAMVNAATLPSGVQIVDNRSGFTSISSTVLTKTVTIANAAMLTLHSVPVKLVDAPGAGDIIEVTNLAINFIFDTSAPTGGGNLTAGYDTTASPAATGTIATALVTSAAANTFGSTYGATTPGASSGMINKGLYLTAASGDFTNGASGHGSMAVTVNYRVLTAQV